VLETREEVEAFQRILAETGGYRSDPARKPAFFSRLFGRFDAWYYLNMGRIIYEGHRIARAGGFDTQAWAEFSVSVVRLVEDCGGKVDVSGLEHPLKLGKPVVFVGNHMSFMEAFFLPALLLHINRLAAVAKLGLLKYPFLGSVAGATDSIWVSRKDPRSDLREVLTQGKAFLRAGRSVVLFPQATRSARFDPANFNSLGVKLAKTAGVPVVPLALKTDFQGNGRLIKDVGPLDRKKTVHFRFGEPIEVRNTGRNVNQQIVRFIEDSLREWST